ncbi:hypothetical protein GEMRC1_002864 [Eukaryota sp. GEM-RC1]
MPITVMIYHLLFGLLLFGCLACEHSCYDSTCTISGGSKERCTCGSRNYGEVTKYYAYCFAKDATACEQSVGRTSCSIEGQHAACGLDSRSYYTTTWFVAFCQARNAPRCSISAYDSKCEIVGEKASCGTTLTHGGRNTYLVPRCNAANAVQCSIKCGGDYCEKLCPQHGKRADCHCKASTSGVLLARCNCL